MIHRSERVKPLAQFTFMNMGEQTGLIDIRSDKARSIISNNISKLLHIDVEIVRSHLDKLQYDDLIAECSQSGNTGKLLNQLESRLAESLFKEKPGRLFKAIILGRTSLRKKYSQAKDPLFAYFISFAILPLKLFSALKKVTKLPAWILIPTLIILIPTILSCVKSDALAIVCTALAIWVWLAGTLFTFMLVFPVKLASVEHTAGSYVERFQGITSLARALTNVGVFLLIIVASYGAFYTLLNSRAPGYHFHLASNSNYPFTSFLYFSLITITTVGYGDIYPLSTFARLITSFEIVQGISLLAVILSYTIGVYNRGKNS